MLSRLESLIESKKPEIPSFLRDLSAVICATITPDGQVIDSNKGFKFITNLDSEPEPSWNARHLFIQPQFHEFFVSDTGDENSPVYQGILNIGDSTFTYRSVSGLVYIKGGVVFVIAEFDIADYERLSASVLELNDDLAQTQRDLVKVNQKLKRNEKRLEEYMLSDSLTEIANRRSYDQHLKVELERFRRYGCDFCLAMADIDLFKSVNDTYGHATGDMVIRRFANLISKESRHSDFVARIGGEEFIILLPKTDLEGAVIIIERLRNLFSEEVFEKFPHRLTASFGLTHSMAGDTAETIFKRIDLALYQAKEGGRNRVVSVKENI